VTGDQALTELLDVSEDVVAAVLLDRDGKPVAAVVGEDQAARVAGIATAMLAYAGALRTGAEAARVEAVTRDGNVYVVVEATGAVVAATGRDPVAGLVYHDLRAVLRKTARRSRARANASS
jgi:hypothetical protein